MHGVFYVIAAVCSSSENAACNNVAAIRRNVLDLQHSHIKLLERIVQSEEELAKGFLVRLPTSAPVAMWQPDVLM